MTITARIRSRGRRSLLAAVTLTAAVSATLTGVALPTPAHAATAPVPPPYPVADPFYDTPGDILSYAPGKVIRSRPVTLTAAGLPSGITSWQLAYRSNDAKGKAYAATTTLIVPAGSYPGTRPLVSYQAAEDSVGSQCAPGYALRTDANSAVLGDVIQFNEALKKGWAVAVPDYEGPKSEFIAGLQAGRAVLDGVRAAQSFSRAGLSRSTPVGLWGYSGGGHATAWASELQGSYAPDLTIAGVSEGGVPADVGAVVRFIDGGAFAGFEFAGIIGLDRAYPEMKLRSVVNAKGTGILDSLQTACELDILPKLAFTKIDDVTLVPNTISQPVYQRIIAINKLGQRKPVAPVFNYHTNGDEIIPVGPANDMLRTYCAQGVKVSYARYPLGEHVTGALIGLQSALDFLDARFQGQPAPSQC